MPERAEVTTDLALIKWRVEQEGFTIDDDPTKKPVEIVCVEHVVRYKKDGMLCNIRICA